MPCGDPEFSEERWAAVTADSRVYHFCAILQPIPAGGHGSHQWTLFHKIDRLDAQLQMRLMKLHPGVCHAYGRIEACPGNGFMLFDGHADTNFCDECDPWTDETSIADLRWAIMIQIGSLTYIEENSK